MCLFLHRNEYTNNAKQWPVVPYSLINQGNDIANEFKTIYNVGFEKDHIIGWSLGIAEKIGRPALVLTKKLMDETTLNESKASDVKWTLDKTETTRYYLNLSPVCGPFKEKSAMFKRNCDHQDELVAIALFKILDTHSKEELYDKEFLIDVDYQIDRVNGCQCETKKLVVQAHKIDDRIYFSYKCPCMHMIEFVFPIVCEEITVALVMAGQVITCVDDVKNMIRVNDPEGTIITEESIKTLEKNNVACMITEVISAITSIENLYMQQVEGERRRIMNNVLNTLAEEERNFSLYKSVIGINNNLYDIANLNEQVIDFFDKTLKIIRDEFGAEHVFVYLDNELRSECNITGRFFSEWVKNPSHRNWFRTISEVDDLFHDFHGLPPKNLSHMTSEQIKPKDPDWSVFVFERATSAHENGYEKNSAPLIIGINYKGGEEGKNRYLRAPDESLFWANYVLPKFAIFARNVMLSVLAYKFADTVIESRISMNHEMGQVTAGVEGITEVFNRRCDALQAKIRRISPDFYNEINTHFDLFIKHCELYAGDMNGQFRRILMKSKIYGDNPKPVARLFDYVPAFLGKWTYIFNSQCRLDNKWPILDYPDAEKRSERMMYTDPEFLEHILFNVVNNAIKYSYINTLIYVKLNKTKDFHTITVTDYGNYLKPGKRDIYQRGVRDVHGDGIRNKEDVNGISESSRQNAIPGMGFGLYLTEKLVIALHGTIDHDCEEVSKYNIPLMRPFFDKYKNYEEMVKKIGNALAEEGDDLPYDDILAEYNRLNDSEQYKNIVYLNKIAEIQKLPFTHFIKHIREKTYKVTFTIMIPHYKEEP